MNSTNIVPRQRSSWLDKHCEIPNPNKTFEELLRSRHLDLGDLTVPELLRESRLTQYRLDRDDDRWNLEWLDARLTAIRAELNTRSDGRQS